MFQVKRIGPAGRDDPTKHLFGVEAIGHRDLLEKKESHPSCILTGFSSRAEAQRLADMFQETYERFHKGE